MAAGLATVMIVAGGWSVFGYIPTKVIGQGTLMTSEEQAHVIEASTPGLVANLLVQDDDHVTENQIIAILEQSELVAQQRIGRNRLAELESNLASVRLQSAQELTSRETVMAALTNTLTFQAEEAQKRTERLTGLLDMMTDLSARGMTRKIEVEKIRQDRDMAITEGSRAQSQLSQEQSAFIEFKGNLNVRITSAERAVQDQQHQLDQLERHRPVSILTLRCRKGAIHPIIRSLRRSANAYGLRARPCSALRPSAIAHQSSAQRGCQCRCAPALQCHRVCETENASLPRPARETAHASPASLGCSIGTAHWPRVGVASSPNSRREFWSMRR
jgi:multidrug efflux pump subunit AcrA (membrane-fusion protein)